MTMEKEKKCCARGALQIRPGRIINESASWNAAGLLVLVPTTGSVAPYAGGGDISVAKKCPNVTCSIGPAQGVPALNCCANGANDSGAK